MANKLEGLNTDWFKILFRNAYTQTHNLSVSGGTEKTNYYISLNYNGEEVDMMQLAMSYPEVLLAQLSTPEESKYFTGYLSNRN